MYRRRRLFFFGGLLLASALVAGGIALVGSLFAGGDPQAGVSAGPAPSGNEAPQDTASPAPVSPGASIQPSTPATPVCDLNLVTVAASTDKPAYAAGEQPLLTMKVTNGGTVPCDVNVGTSQMEFLVMSGTDRIFSSKDCQVKGADLVKIIAPGASETANFPWQRNRTQEGCPVVAAKPGAGGATYTFVARLGNKSSTKAVFQLN